ncbi:nitroreductase/quinone reductase family protein [Nocardia terpenica]|uniref:Nitroreductase family deazaflavin-dependent oxidoreductase n=1 Tax=Nocardia terpenica TaxID=455432 RepID=A0A6G9YUR8_9NOCA|nr:nitroreductase/quinone reductase family protein [Nocardia terpenica]QIS16958.1 nitroreductase family deazaflavin-dependent oxidoreductase [Nocardia terpenica]
MVAHSGQNGVWPEVRWGDAGSVFSRTVTAVAATRIGSWLARHGAGLDRRILVRTNGRRTILGPIGAPLLLLVTIGRKTSRRITTPLVYMREADRLLIVGTNGGLQRPPNWVANLRAHPEADVIMAGRQIPITACEIFGRDKDKRFHVLIDSSPVFAAYLRRIQRDIPMFALEQRRGRRSGSPHS